MSPDFEYFHWASPMQDKPLFALYDLFDNHLMVQSYSYDILFTLRKIIRSKTTLEIVELTNVENLVKDNLIDNSVIELWGIDSPSTNLYADATPRWEQNNVAETYYADVTIKHPTLVAVDPKFDNFKLDLQKQIFFIHYCLERKPTELALAELQRAVELGVDCDDVIGRFLDFSHIEDKAVVQAMLYFLRASELFYE